MYKSFWSVFCAFCPKTGVFNSLKMKKFNLFFAMVCCCAAMCFAALPAVAQNVTVVNQQQQEQSYLGTYYFTSQGTKAVDKQSSEYYRVVVANNDFNDYYSNGDMLRAKGTIAYMEESDDNNTVFDGVFEAYYPSGKVWIQQTFKNRHNEGEFTEYYESGLIKEHETYNDGVLDGIKTTFTEKGDTCYQYVYDNGKLQNDTYTQSGDGYSVNYNAQTKKPIWNQASDVQVKNLMDKSGDDWKYYTLNGLYVSINVKYRHYYGRYYVVNVYIQNNSPENAYFNFDNASITAGGGRVRLFSHDEYVRRVNNRQAWTAFGLSMATVVTAATLDAAINSSYYDDWGYHSPGSNFAHDFSSFIIEESAVAGTVMINGYMTNEMIKVQQNNIGYLKNYMVAPKNAVSGYALAKYDPSVNQISVNLPINGVVYSFRWNTGNLQDADER